jgi:thymidine kinase
MFLEPRFRGQRSGWIEVVTGCMFSGKTEELLRRIKRSKIAGQEVVIFKPARDTRYSDTYVVSHDENAMDSIVVKQAKDMYQYMDQYEVIGIDEAQFFDQDLVHVCEEMALEGKRIIAAGLDLDFKGRPFGPIPHLLAVSEYVTKVHAICPHCGNLATHSYRLSEEQDTVLLGEKDKYEPRCRKCYSMGNILQLRLKK